MSVFFIDEEENKNGIGKNKLIFVAMSMTKIQQLSSTK